MEFYHILPSNSSTLTYPNNHASLFRIPIPSPYILEDDWEVALMNLTHSNCIDTFDNERLLVQKLFKDYSGLKEVTCATKVHLSIPKGKNQIDFLSAIISEMNTKLSDLLKIEFANEDSNYKVLNFTRIFQTQDFFFVLSEKLVELFQLSSDVFTHWDNVMKKYIHDKEVKFSSEDELSVTIIPLNLMRKEIVIKESNEDISLTKLINLANEKLNIDGKQIARLSLGPHHNVKFEKLQDDNYIVICSEHFHDALKHHQSGFHKPNSQMFLSYDMTQSYKSQFSIFVYKMNSIPYNFAVTKVITLKRQPFSTAEDVINYINDCVKYDKVKFKCDKKNKVKMEISAKDMQVTFENDLRDILGFDENSYKGIGSYSASVALSLTRRIQYLYIYSDICDMVRVGDTKAPLLAAIPFNAKECRLLTEKRFTLPMYIPIRKTYISDITIGIYDDAGKNVPFHRDAITCVRLHFRKREKGRSVV